MCSLLHIVAVAIICPLASICGVYHGNGACSLILYPGSLHYFFCGASCLHSSIGVEFRICSTSMNNNVTCALGLYLEAIRKLIGKTSKPQHHLC